MAATFTPLYGVEENSPVCSVLEFHSYTILLDCGWDFSFDEALLEPLKQVIHDIDFVLISHPDIYHIGALPYAFAKLGLDAPIFCTLPVVAMGKVCLLDIYQTLAKFKFDLFTPKDIEMAFSGCQRLEYSQEHKFHEKADSISIAPHTAGRLLGGAVWRIFKDTDEVVYAVDYNQLRDRHLDRTVLSSLKRPAVLITNAHKIAVHKAKRQDRDKVLFEAIISTLNAKGDVLMPTDASGRVLELLLLLNDRWLIFVQPVTSVELLAAIPPPRLILASNEWMDTGFSQDVFTSLVHSATNLILFTSKVSHKALQTQLNKHPPPESVTFVKRRVVILEGVELQEFLERRKIEEFPFQERKQHIDAYGVSINPADFILDDAVVDTEDLDVEMKETVEVDSFADAAAIPTKTILETEKLQVQCRIGYVDMEGRSDGLSIAGIFTSCEPRKVIINGSKAAKHYLANHCHEKLKNKVTEVHIPEANQCVDIYSETNLFRAKLTSDLMEQLRFVKVGGFDVAYLNSQIKIDYSTSTIPMLTPTEHANLGHSAVFLGDVKLSDVQKALSAQGLPSILTKGVLICGNGVVTIRKVSATQIAVQGTLCDDYFTIRSALYGQFQIV